MENGLGIILKGFLAFEVKIVVKKFSIYDRKIHEKMLKSYVEIKFDSIGESERGSANKSIRSIN